MRTLEAVLTIGVAIGFAPAVTAQSSIGDATTATLTLLVSNAANVPADFLSQAEEIVTLVYHDAGVPIVWSAPDLSSRRPAMIRRVVLLSGESTRRLGTKARVSENSIGMTPCNENDRGRRTYVFYDRVESQAVKRQVPVGRLLGEVIAHEVGHMLLPIYSHSDRGIMKSQWRVRFSQLELFTKEQARLIRARIAAESALQFPQ